MNLHVAMGVRGFSCASPRPTSCRTPNKFSLGWKLPSTGSVGHGGAPTEKEAREWEACKEALRAFDFSKEDAEKMLGKAFGHVASSYWGEERKRETPRYESVAMVLAFLKGIGLENDDVSKMVKKFPEVLGCHVDEELSPNVKALESVWGIQGKALRNLLLRNPKVLGYNVDCKGDCLAQCTRCWVRF